MPMFFNVAPNPILVSPPKSLYSLASTKSYSHSGKCEGRLPESSNAAGSRLVISCLCLDLEGTLDLDVTGASATRRDRDNRRRSSSWGGKPIVA